MKPMMWVALLATVGSALYVANQESADVEPVVRAGKRDAPPAAKSMGSSKPRTANSADADRLEKLNQALNDWLAHRHVLANHAPATKHAGVAFSDMGAWASQQPPPPPPPPPYVAPPPPPPMAPPFAHTWVGRYVDTEGRAVIAGTSQTWVVKVGDVIDSQWRVDAIADRQLTLTYLPLNQSQTVSMK